MQSNDHVAAVAVASELARREARCVASVALDNSYGRFLSAGVRDAFAMRYGGVAIGDVVLFASGVRAFNVFDPDVFDTLLDIVDDDEFIARFFELLTALEDGLTFPLFDLLDTIDASIAKGLCKDRSEVVVHVVASTDAATVLQEALYVFGAELGGLTFIGADGEVFDPSLVALSDARTFATMFVWFFASLPCFNPVSLWLLRSARNFDPSRSTSTRTRGASTPSTQ